MKFGTRVGLKPSNDGGEFELDRARSKNDISENLFALGHETDNSLRLKEIWQKVLTVGMVICSSVYLFQLLNKSGRPLSSGHPLQIRPLCKEAL